jgi:hypothetical protein
LAEPAEAEQTSGSYPSERPRGPQAHHQGRKPGQRAGRGQRGHPVVRSPCPRLRMQLCVVARSSTNQADLLGVDFVGSICEGHQAPVGTALAQGVLAACLAAWPLAWGVHCEAMPVGGRTATRHGQCDVGSRYIPADGGTGRAGSTAALLNTARSVLWPGRSCGWSY